MSGRSSSRSTRTTSSRADGAYREWRPRAELGGFVTRVWHRTIPASAPAPTRVLPDGCADVVVRSDGTAFVAGPDTGPVLNEAPAGTSFVGLRFRIGAAGPALGLPAGELRDLRVPLEELWGRRAHELAERVAAATSARERLALLQDATARQLVDARPPDPLVLAAVGQLGVPGARVSAVGHELGLSERELRRRFVAAVGYGPKRLDRVLRFRRFLADASATPARGDRWTAPSTRPSLARIAADLGYADQAHLTRASRELSGLPPSQLLAYWSA